MMYKGLLEQAKEFGFEIYENYPKIQTMKFDFADAILQQNSDEQEKALFEDNNYVNFVANFDSKRNISYCIKGLVADNFVVYDNLSENGLRNSLKLMVAEELYYRNYGHVDASNSMSGESLLLKLGEIGLANRKYPLYLYDEDCGDQFPITDLDILGFKIATTMGTNTAAYDSKKIMTIEDVLLRLSEFPAVILSKPMHAIDLETKQATTIESISLYDDSEEISDTNQLAINVDFSEGEE